MKNKLKKQLNPVCDFGSSTKATLRTSVGLFRLNIFLLVHTHVSESAANRLRCGTIREPLAQTEIDQLDIAERV